MILFEGISLWPSIALRLATLILTLFLIFLAWAQIEINLKTLAKEMRLQTPRIILNRYNNYIAADHLSMLYKIRHCFMVQPRQGQLSKTLYDIDQAWEHFVIQGRPFARFCRIIFCIAMMWGVANILFALYGQQVTHARSDIVREIYFYLTFSDVLLMFFLIFLVVDATLFCYMFVQQLAKGATLWPKPTRDYFESELGLADPQPPQKQIAPARKQQNFLVRVLSARVYELRPIYSLPPVQRHHHLLDDWIDLNFIGKRTDCINTLIYYPFAVIALMMVSRSAVFGDFPLSQPILITQVASLVIVAGCAIALNRVAEDARNDAKRHLMDAIIKAKGSRPEASQPGQAGQWESLLDRVNALQEGAFRPFLQQPIIGAVLLPLSSVGWTTLLEKGIFGL